MVRVGFLGAADRLEDEGLDALEDADHKFGALGADQLGKAVDSCQSLCRLGRAAGCAPRRPTKSSR